VSAKLTAAPVRTRISAAFRAGWSRSEFPTDGLGAPVDSNQFTSAHTVTAGAEASHDLHERISATAAITATDLRLEFSDRSDSPGDTSGFAFASERAVDGQRLAARLGLDVRPVPGATISAGAQLDRDAERQSGVSTSNFGAGAFTDEQPPFDHTRWNRAYFLQGTADLRRRLGATAGIRLDDNEAFGDFVTARAGISYALPSATRVRASLGTAFKAPTFAENFAASPFEVGNPALEPERTRSWEVGVEQIVARGMLTVSAAWFDQRFRHLIQYVAAAPGDPTYENLGAARARGLETGARLLVGGGVSLTGQYTYLETRVTSAGAGGSPSFADGERLLRRPTHAARGALGLRRGVISASAALSATGSRDDVDFGTFERVTLPAYVTLDLAGAVAVLPRGSGAGLTLIMRLENALDEEYVSVAGFPGRRRTFFAGARIER
jgi:vitamin B12 transporter